MDQEGERTDAGNRLKKIYVASSLRKRTFIAIASILSLVAVVVSVSIGAVDISLSDTVRVFLHAILPLSSTIRLPLGILI